MLHMFGLMPRGSKYLKNDMGSVDFSKHPAGTPPPLPPKKGYVRPNKVILGKTYH